MDAGRDGSMTTSAEPVGVEEIRAARERIKDAVLRLPLVKLNFEEAPAEIYLKLENLQPIGSFKLRGAGNAMLSAPREQLEQGVWTASAGNMAQGVAWYARRLGVKCTVVAPDHAPETKLAAIKRLGADVVKTPFDSWFRILSTREFPGMTGLFVHPVSDRPVMAGNGTIGLEILEDLPDVNAVIIPYGGGGLSGGIGSAMRALKPDTKLYAVEVSTAAPVAASFAAGEPTEIDYKATFVDGMGGPRVLPDMWPLISQLLDGSLVVELDEIAAAIRLLAERNRVIAEGAGAAPVAAALAGKAGSGKVVCVVSGGNLDASKLTTILQGGVP
jgi:threonine dehydratase